MRNKSKCKAVGTIRLLGLRRASATTQVVRYIREGFLTFANRAQQTNTRGCVYIRFSLKQLQQE